MNREETNVAYNYITFENKSLMQELFVKLDKYVHKHEATDIDT